MLLFEVSNKTRRYYICANDKQEAMDIAKFAFKMQTKGKYFNAIPIYTLYRMDGRSVPIDDFLDGIGASSGYINGSGTVMQEYANGFEWYPFTPFNVRQHFIDLALAAL